MRLTIVVISILFFSHTIFAQMSLEKINATKTHMTSKPDSVALQYAATIQVSDMQKHLNVLASDEYEGREAGTEANRKAARYIAEQFKSFGLPAIGEGNTYFQPVSFTWTMWDEVGMEINGNYYRHKWDFLSVALANNNMPELKQKKLLFLGYGIDDAKYSDYTDAKVEGKVILIYSGEPYKTDGTSYITGSKKPSDWTTDWKKKLKVAREKGVKAVLIIDHELQKKMREEKSTYPTGAQLTLGEDKDPATQYANHCFISTTIARDIMGKKKDKVIAVREQIKNTGESTAIKLPCKFKLMQKKDVKKLEGENVLGYIEGSDPKVKNEVVIVTAHYDHLGKRGDAIYNGADDNGSGTSTVIEVAQAFAEAKKQGHGPRRSVLIMPVTGEEKGLLGSQYYVEYPVFPLENTVANVNVDMVGRVDKKYKDNPYYVYVIGSDRLSTELHTINENANSTYTNLVLDYTYNAEDDPNRYYYRSDHYNFAERGIPAIFYFNGTHADYHRTTDTAEKINFEKMQKIGELIFYTTWELANRDKRIVVDVK